MNVVAKRKFDEQWQTWLRTNLATGCDKDGLFKILLDNGFDYDVVRRQMNYEPELPIYMLRNPLKDPQRKAAAEPQQKCEPLDRSEFYVANAKEARDGEAVLHDLDAFLTDDEVQQLLEQIVPLAATQAAPVNKAFDLKKAGAGGAVLQALDKRISRLIGIHESFAGNLHALRLENDASSSVHYNLAIPSQEGRELAFTVVVCLSVAAGASLKMSSSDIEINVRPAALMIWQYPKGSSSARRYLSTGENNPGDTIILVKNYYYSSAAKPAPDMYIKEANEYIKNYTKTGFVHTRMDADLFAKISDFYQKNRVIQANETVEGGYVYNTEGKKKQSSTLVHLTEELKKEIHDNVVPLVSEWCGKELEPSYVYGIREYKDKAVLKSHRDRIETHVLGVIINVDQDIHQEWPLIIDDHSYREHEIYLKPGDMIFYESARLQHGRPRPFSGNSFANIFCHLRPVDYVLRR